MSTTEHADHTGSSTAYFHSATGFFGKNADHSRKGGPEAWTIWLLATIFVVWLFSIQTGYAIVSPSIQSDAHLTIAEVGLAASIYTWVFAAVQFFSGALLDRFGLRPLMTIAVALVTVGAFMYAGTTNFFTLAAAQVVMAVGSSFGFVGAGYVGGKWFEAAKYGLMFGLVQTVAALGSAVAQPVVSAFLNVMTWKQLLSGFGALGVLLVIAFAFVVRNPVSMPEEKAAAKAAYHGRNIFVAIIADLAKCFRNSQVLFSALFAGASFGALLAVGVLWGPRVEEARGYSLGFAAVVVSMAWVGLAAGSPIFNVISDKWGSRKWPSLVGLLLQLVALILFIYGPQGAAGDLVLAFAIGFFCGAHMLGFTIAGESVPPSSIGSAAAIVNGFCFIIGGILAAVPGWLLVENPGLADYQRALMVMPIVLGVGTLCTLMLREPNRG